MSDSINGWPVLDSSTTGPLPRLRKLIIPTPGAPAERHLYVRDGSAGFALGHLATWYHDEVERLDLGTWDDWGWAPRPVRGGSTPSNHASGTAIDLNATRHPQHTAPSRSFTARQIHDIRARLRFYGGRITWGGDWSPQWVDPMHFELTNGTTLAQMEQLARRLMDTPRGHRLLEANPGLQAIIKS